MGSANEFLNNFNFLAWIESVIILILMLGVAHWFPWSFHLGQGLSRYWAFVCGCVSIVASFGLWSIAENHLIAWMWFLPIIGFLHWIPWAFDWFYKESLPRPVAYVITSLPVVSTYSAWAIWTAEYEPLAVLLSLYTTGGLATLILYYLDITGIHTFNNHNAKR